MKKIAYFLMWFLNKIMAKNHLGQNKRNGMWPKTWT